MTELNPQNSKSSSIELQGKLFKFQIKLLEIESRKQRNKELKYKNKSFP